jgi:hypothetical protein
VERRAAPVSLARRQRGRLPGSIAEAALLIGLRCAGRSCRPHPPLRTSHAAVPLTHGAAFRPLLMPRPATPVALSVGYNHDGNCIVSAATTRIWGWDADTGSNPPPDGHAGCALSVGYPRRHPHRHRQRRRDGVVGRRHRRINSTASTATPAGRSVGYNAMVFRTSPAAATRWCGCGRSHRRTTHRLDGHTGCVVGRVQQ